MSGSSGGHDFDTLGSERVYDGAIVALRVDTVAMPGGGTAQREVVEHDDAVVVVALDADGRVVLLRQYRHPLGERLLELPAGLCDVEGEDPADAAARELVEEVGLRASNWEPLVRIATSPGFSTERVQIYLATGLTEVDRPDAADEEADMTSEWWPLDAALAAVRDGRIVNGIAVTGLLAARDALSTR